MGNNDIADERNFLLVCVVFWLCLNQRIQNQKMAIVSIVSTSPFIFTSVLVRFLSVLNGPNIIIIIFS